MTKQAFHARIWSKLADYNREWKLLRPGDRILIGVSGGADSVCLAHYLHKLSQRMKFSLHILHLHHGLRGSAADRDARFVEKLGTGLGIPVTVRSIPVRAFAKKSGRGLEDAGRALRYREFAAEAKKLDYNKVATAHQMDDVAETFLLNLMRGTQAKGLMSIPPRRPSFPHHHPIMVVRPLLCLSRKEIIEYLKYHRLSYRTDLSNNSEEFTRNWVRRKVLPLLEKRSPGIREHIALIARDLQRRLS